MVRTPEGHLLWTGCLANGYPAAKFQGKNVYLKRLIWERAHRPIPKGAVVVSTCGERTCIEPSHLALSGPGRYAGSRGGLGRYADEPEGKTLSEAQQSAKEEASEENMLRLLWAKQRTGE
jgi:hypothetical protein